ncbi:MAG: hypothetical protein GY777_03550, partial [Candidatus Brocadiaceae bacterium]|nr:hypothetical protein [Candidatus Brocadiaceae bacterium]
DPSLELDPKQEAGKLTAQKLLEEGRDQAKTGDIEGAIKLFQDALQLDPSLELDPKQEARKLEAQGLLEEGRDQVKTGDIEGAIAALTKAQNLDLALIISANYWDNLCWYGSLYGHAEDVMFACEKAVELETSNGLYHQGRGLARSLTGNIEGAIKDFHVYIEWETDEERKSQHQGWVDDLKAGISSKNIFTPEVIEDLKVQ